MYHECEFQFQNLETEMSGKNKIQLVPPLQTLLNQYHLDLKAFDEMKRFYNEQVPDHPPVPQTSEGLLKAIHDLELERHLFWERKKKMEELQNEQDGSIQPPMNFEEVAPKKVNKSKKEEKARAKEKKRKASLQTNNPVEIFDHPMKVEVKDTIPDRHQVPELEEQFVQGHAQEQNIPLQNHQIPVEDQQDIQLANDQQVLPANDPLVSHGSYQVPDEEPRLTGKWPKSPKKQQKPHVQFNQPQLPQIHNPTDKSDSTLDFQ